MTPCALFFLCFAMLGQVLACAPPPPPPGLTRLLGAGLYLVQVRGSSSGPYVRVAVAHRFRGRGLGVRRVKQAGRLKPGDWGVVSIYREAGPRRRRGDVHVVPELADDLAAAVEGWRAVGAPKLDERDLVHPNPSVRVLALLQKGREGVDLSAYGAQFRPDNVGPDLSSLYVEMVWNQGGHQALQQLVPSHLSGRGSHGYRLWGSVEDLQPMMRAMLERWDAATTRHALGLVPRSELEPDLAWLLSDHPDAGVRRALVVALGWVRGCDATRDPSLRAVLVNLASDTDVHVADLARVALGSDPRTVILVDPPSRPRHDVLRWAQGG